MADANDQASLLLRSAEAERDRVLEEARSEAAGVRAAADTNAPRARRQRPDGPGRRPRRRQPSCSSEPGARSRRSARPAPPTTPGDDRAARRGRRRATLEPGDDRGRRLREAAEREACAAPGRRREGGRCPPGRGGGRRTTPRGTRPTSCSRAARRDAEDELRRAPSRPRGPRRTVDAVLAAAAAEAQAIRPAGHADAGTYLRAGPAAGSRLCSRGSPTRQRAEAAESDRRATRARTTRPLLPSQPPSSEAVERRPRPRTRRARSSSRPRTPRPRLTEMAERRSAESEAGAHSLRALVADEVVSLRSEGAEALRRSREESARLLTEAQADADRVRDQARAGARGRPRRGRSATSPPRRASPPSSPRCPESSRPWPYPSPRTKPRSKHDPARPPVPRR